MTTQLLNKLVENFNLQSRIFRRAIRTSIAVFISVILYRHFSLTQGFWFPLTIVIVMQASTAATLRKGLQRFLGTIIGIVIGSLLALHIHNSYSIDFLLIFFLFVAYYAKSFNLINYGIFVVPLTIMVVFLVSALVPQESHHLILARLYDTSLGALLGVLITLFVFPNSLEQDVDKGIKKTIKIQYQYFNAVLNLLLARADSKQLALQKRERFEQCLSTNRILFNEWIYELWLKLEPKHRHENIIIQIEKLGQFLFALHHLARSGIPESLSTQLNSIIYNLSRDALLAAKHDALINSAFSTTLKQIIKEIHEIKNRLTNDDDLLFITSLLVNLEDYNLCLIELQHLLMKLFSFKLA